MTSESSATCYLGFASAAPATITVSVAQVSAIDVAFTRMWAPARASHKKAFGVSARLSTYNGFASPVRFIIERRRAGMWHAFSSVGSARTEGGDLSFGPEPWLFEQSLKLHKGAYRIYARFHDAAHASILRTRPMSVTVR